MKFSAREDIEAPIDAVFDMVSDFDGFERIALRRGVDVQRIDDLMEPGAGMTWRAGFELRRQRRELVLELTRYDRPVEMLLNLSSNGFSGEFGVDIIALSRTRTRIAVFLEVRPKTFSARLVLQSLRLAKKKLTQRFKKRVADYAMHIEERYSRVR